MKIKLLTTGGYKGLEGAVGKELEATLLRGTYLITATTLREAGGLPCMHEYVFFKREVETVWLV